MIQMRWVVREALENMEPFVAMVQRSENTSFIKTKKRLVLQYRDCIDDYNATEWRDVEVEENP